MRLTINYLICPLLCPYHWDTSFKGRRKKKSQVKRKIQLVGTMPASPVGQNFQEAFPSSEAYPRKVGSSGHKVNNGADFRKGRVRPSEVLKERI